MARPARTVALTLALLVTAVAAFLAAAWLGDRLTDQAGPASVATAPAIDDPVLSPGPADGDGNAVPGALLAVEPDGPATVGIEGGRWILPAELIGDVPETTIPAGEPDGTAPEATAPDTTTGAGGTTPAPVPVVTPNEATAAAEQYGAIALAPPSKITRFVDLCAGALAGASGCPFGTGATVVPLAGDTPGASIDAKIWPGVNGTTDAAVRCDPGYETASTLPVVITTTAPVARLDVTLTLAGVGLLDDRTMSTGQDERSRWQTTVTGGGAVTTDLGSGVQHCLSLATEGAAKNVAAYPGVTVPDPRTYTIEIFALADQGPASVRTSTTYTPAPRGPRPPTLLEPLSGHVVQVVTAEQPGTTSRAHLRYLGPRTVDDACADAWGTTAGAEPPGKPKAVNPALLAQASYPYDRTWNQVGVRNLVLPEAERFALCLEWSTPTGTEQEAWRVETPDGFRPAVTVKWVTKLSKLPPAQRDWVVSAPSSGCPSAVVLDENDTDDHLTGGKPGSTAFRCESFGLPFPLVTTLQMDVREIRRTTPGQPTQLVTVDMGKLRVLTPSWCTGTATGWTGVAPGVAGPTLAGCQATRWTTTVYWRDQNVLCGGDCPEYTRASAHADVELDDWSYNGRRDPLAWIIVGPPGTKSPGVPGGAPGPTGP